MSTIFGATQQLGLVVNDFNATIKHWVEVQGVGPFYYFTDAMVDDYRYQGEKSPPPVLSIAFAYSGDLQIEIIHQQNNAPSCYLDFLDSGREGLNHISSFLDEAGFKIAYQKAIDNQSKPITEGSIGGTRFAYFNTAQCLGATICEISESAKDGTREIFEIIKSASVNWNGQDPIRLLSIE